MDSQMWDGCDVCGEDHDTQSCPVLNMDELACPTVFMTRARVTLPHFLELVEPPEGPVQVVTKVELPARKKLGPFEARRTTQKISTDDGFVLMIMVKESGTVCLDTTDENNCNWLCLVPTATDIADQNLIAVQLGSDIFYITTKIIPAKTALRVWYAPHYARKVGASVEPDGKTEGLLGRKLVSPQEVLILIGEENNEEDRTPDQGGCSEKETSDGKIEENGSGQEQPNNDYRYMTVLQDLFHQAQTKANITFDPNQSSEGPSVFDIPSQTVSALSQLATPRAPHIKHNEQADGPHMCRQCDAVFQELRDLAKHVKEHLKPAEKKSRGRPSRGRPTTLRRTGRRPKLKHSKEIGAKIKNQPIEDAESDAATKPNENSMEESVLEKTAIKIVDVTKNCSPPPAAENEDGTKVISTVLNIKGSPSARVQNQEQTRRSTRLQEKTSPKTMPFQPGEVCDDDDDVSDGDGTITAEFMAPEDDILPNTTGNQVTKGKTLKTGEAPPAKRRRIRAKIPQTPVPVRASRREITRNCTITFDDNKHAIHKCNHCKETFTKLEAFAKHLSSVHTVKCTMCSQTFVSIVDMESHKCSGFPKEESTASTYACEGTGKTEETPKEVHKSRPNVETEELQSQESEKELTQDTQEKTCIETLQELHEHEPGSVKIESRALPQSVEEEPLPPSHEEVAAEGPEQPEESAEIQVEETPETGCHHCTICGKIFRKLKYLLRHVRGHTDAFYCSKCQKRFVRKESLQKHHCNFEDAEQDEGGPFFCEFCGTDFSKKKYLFRHMAAHTGEFKCRKCDREFSRKESQLQHMVKCCPELVDTEGEAYPCPSCNRVFTRALSLQNHMKLHTKAFKCEKCQRCFASHFTWKKHVCGNTPATGPNWKCSECDKTFTKEMYLQRHMAIHNGDFVCVICGRRFGRKEELMKHTLECTAMLQIESGEEIKCPVCAETFVDPPAFRIHYSEHTHPYQCNHCAKRFLRKANLDGHKCNLVEQPTVDCNICGKKFRQLKYLQRHMSVHGAPKYTCGQCNRGFHRLDFYNNHTCRSASGEIVPVPRIEKPANPGKGDPQAICPTCGKTYVTVSNLNKHMKTHGEKNETCEVCGKRFHLKIALREHIESVHTDEYKHQCQHCGKFMKCKNSLFGHIRQFHSETITLFACDQCSKNFRQKGNLKKHLLTHSQKKTFKCGYCVDKSFKYPEQLRRHNLWHTEGQRFQCEFCKRKFVMMFELRKHMRIFHSGIIYTCEFCFTECRHFHTMKRHLLRRHPEERNWQADPTSYIKGLVRDANETAEEKDQRKNKAEDITEVELQVNNQQENTDSVLPILEDQPFIVAEVSGIADGDSTETTRTVIIQTAGQQFNTGLMSQEVAAALQSLSKQGALDDHNTMTIIQNVGNSQAEVLSLPEGALQDEQGFIIVPMLTTDNGQEGLNVFSSITTENPQSDT